MNDHCKQEPPDAVAGVERRLHLETSRQNLIRKRMVTSANP